MTNTPTGGGRINTVNNYLVTTDDIPYIIKSVKDELFQVVFLKFDGFYNHIKNIIEEAGKQIIETAFKDDKFFTRVLGEVFENIGQHSSLVMPPEFLLKKESHQYVIEVNNFCSKENFEKLRGFTAINSMSLAEIKEAYKNQVLGGKVSDKGGAGLGIYTIAKLAKKHNQNKEFSFITVENLGTISNGDSFETLGETNDLVHIKITLQIPFPDKTDITNEHHIDG